MAILIISHNLNVVRHMTDRMAIMYLGRFIEVGSTEQSLITPVSPTCGRCLRPILSLTRMLC
ncbi:hypothetical protein NKI09_20690 [Mesorhizobium sp. M0757]|uniref:hypothetical protein n=1 Tax=unclassified Mesorhizobium TaxID=325217 RepID=UPI00333D6D77